MLGFRSVDISWKDGGVTFGSLEVKDRKTTPSSPRVCMCWKKFEKPRCWVRLFLSALFHSQWGCGNIESVIIMQLQISRFDLYRARGQVASI